MFNSGNIPNVAEYWPVSRKLASSTSALNTYTTSVSCISKVVGPLPQC